MLIMLLKILLYIKISSKKIIAKWRNRGQKSGLLVIVFLAVSIIRLGELGSSCMVCTTMDAHLAITL